jgi:hypothetical protein
LFYEVNAKILCFCGQRSHPQVFTGRSRQAKTRKHYKKIIAAGSIVISLTFAARDSIHDRPREYVNSVETAESFYRLGAESGLQSYEIEEKLIYLMNHVTKASRDPSRKYLPKRVPQSRQIFFTMLGR